MKTLVCYLSISSTSKYTISSTFKFIFLGYARSFEKNVSWRGDPIGTGPKSSYVIVHCEALRRDSITCNTYACLKSARVMRILEQAGRDGRVFRKIKPSDGAQSHEMTEESPGHGGEKATKIMELSSRTNFSKQRILIKEVLTELNLHLKSWIASY